jgi:hypothetical protein
VNYLHNTGYLHSDQTVHRKYLNNDFDGPTTLELFGSMVVEGNVLEAEWEPLIFAPNGNQ